VDAGLIFYTAAVLFVRAVPIPPSMTEVANVRIGLAFILLLPELSMLNPFFS
jgi:hypothetical protein